MSRAIRASTLAMTLVALSALPAHATWSRAVIANFGNSDSHTSSLVISPTSRAFVAWQSQGGDELYWAKRTSRGWDVTTVNGENTFTGCYESENDWVGPSAAFLPDGTPQIASVCIDFPGGEGVLYSAKIAGVWSTKTIGYGPVGPCDSSASDIDLIDSPTKHQPVIVITDPCTQSLTGFFFDGSSWIRKTLVSGTTGPFRYGALSLAVDPTNGKLAVAFNGDVYGRGGLILKEFSWGGKPVPGSTVIFDPPQGDVATGEPSLAFLPDGTGFLAFQESTPYGTPSGSAYAFLALVTRTSGAWSTAVSVDASVLHTGAEPSLSLSGGTLHVAYHDTTNGDLRYATSSDGSLWTSETIAGRDDVGNFPALAVTQGGKALIAHYNLTATALVSSIGP